MHHSAFTILISKMLQLGEASGQDAGRADGGGEQKERFLLVSPELFSDSLGPARKNARSAIDATPLNR